SGSGHISDISDAGQACNAVWPPGRTSMTPRRGPGAIARAAHSVKRAVWRYTPRFDGSWMGCRGACPGLTSGPSDFTSDGHRIAREAQRDMRDAEEFSKS